MIPYPTEIQDKLDNEISNIVMESAVYHQFFNSKKEAENLSYADFLKNKLLMIQIIKEGIPYSLFSLIQDYTPLTEEGWANLLDISTKSLQRYKQQAKQFKPIHSEKIIEMSEVSSVGLELFGKMEKFKTWLGTPNFSLGNQKPLDLLSDSYGKELVLSELTRINHGIFA